MRIKPGSTSELTVTTGLVSVKPYPSYTGMPAALKKRAKRGASAAEPHATARMLSKPSAVFTLLKTSFRAIPNFHS